jgi:hypothetical protein
MRHEENEYVPLWDTGGAASDAVMVGVFTPTDEGQPSTGFVDGFGVRWVASESAGGAQIPAPGEFILKDVTRWKKDITIPDVEKYDWQKLAEE